MGFEVFKQNFRLRPGRDKRRSKIDAYNSHEVMSDQEDDPVNTRALRSIGEFQHLEQDRVTGRPNMAGRKADLNSPSFSFNSNAPVPLLPTNNRHSGQQTMPQTLRREPSVELDRTMAKTPFLATDERAYDLAAPPPKMALASIEVLWDMLFSQDHLETILRESAVFSQFTAFLQSYRPHIIPILVRYLEASKAAKAVQYANALVVNLRQLDGEKRSQLPTSAASTDAYFEAKKKRCLEVLLQEALPAFITFRLVKNATEQMLRELVDVQQPAGKDLVKGLTKVFCITDPQLPDNPVIFASADFYRMTGYNRDQVLGRNCRVLQGYRKEPPAVLRLRRALEHGEEITEAILNYRRDGSAFVNCLNVSPLLDDKGKVRYWFGAQVDVSNLVEAGNGFSSLASLLKNNQNNNSFTNGNHSRESSGAGDSDKPLQCLSELSEMLDMEEATTIQQGGERNPYSSNGQVCGVGTERRIILQNMTTKLDRDREVSATSPETSTSLKASKLPSVYQDYFLVRPDASFRITFLSPSLRHLGKELLQSRFLSHITASDSVVANLKQCLMNGLPTTAKIRFHKGDADSDDSGNSSRQATKCLSATPLFGSDDRVGVWVIILVDKPPAYEDATEGAQRVVPSIPRPQQQERGGSDESLGRPRGPRPVQNPPPLTASRQHMTNSVAYTLATPEFHTPHQEQVPQHSSTDSQDPYQEHDPLSQQNQQSYRNRLNRKSRRLSYDEGSPESLNGNNHMAGISAHASSSEDAMNGVNVRDIGKADRAPRAGNRRTMARPDDVGVARNVEFDDGGYHKGRYRRGD